MTIAKSVCLVAFFVFPLTNRPLRGITIVDIKNRNGKRKIMYIYEYDRDRNNINILLRS